MDPLTPANRSKLMAKIRSTGSRLERSIRARLVSRGLRGFRLHASDLPGNPDVAFDRFRLAVFVDSCFWHGCPQHCRIPHSKRAYWIPKIDKNRQRDKLVTTQLENMGWWTLRMMECEIDRSFPRLIELLRPGRHLSPTSRRKAQAGTF